MGAETHGKCVELFRDMLPSGTGGVFANAADPVFANSFLEHAQRAGRSVHGKRNQSAS